ncbi:hypothetical protein BKA69DRAFT_1123786 [Paraphysoderma sedebokerense]|nr:hypothetical protein BKA69DRAFT_1123786 [Paraphysoderma sedebokerense]
MPVYLGIIGCLLLPFVLYDIILTALSSSKSGPITRWITIGFHQIALGIVKISRHHGDYVLELLVFWSVGTWTAWVLIFRFSDKSIINNNTGETANFAQTIYFTGFTIFTLGMGDYVPNTDAYRITTGIACGTGVFVMSLSTAYVLGVNQAAAQQRSLASSISSMGGSAVDILINAWNGKDFGSLDSQLQGIASGITSIAEALNTYPVLSNVHSANAHTSISVRISAVDELLTILFHVIPNDIRPDKLTLILTRNAISSYIRGSFVTGLRPSKKAPRASSIEPLAKAGISLLMDDNSWKTMCLCDPDVIKRRKTLAGLVERGARDWDMVLSQSEK